MALAIRKKVSFELLGDEYKESYIVFKALPVSEYEQYLDKVEEIQKDEKTQNRKAIGLMLDTLKAQFIEGKFPDDKGELQSVVKEDIDALDGEAVLHAFGRLTGQSVPKAPESA